MSSSSSSKESKKGSKGLKGTEIGETESGVSSNKAMQAVESGVVSGATAAARHFDRLFAHYGGHITVLNLVRD